MALTVAGALAACGGQDPNQPAGGGPIASTAPKAPTGNATAEEVAEEARGDVDCPPRIKSPARAANAPVDDVVGVRPGLTFEEASNAVLCTHDLMVITPDTSRRFNINTYGATIRQGFTARFAEPRVEKSSRQIMKEMQDDMFARSGNAVRQDVKPGQSKWYVGTMGVPGKERVISVAREEWFEEGRKPATASVEQALIRKYGSPTRLQKHPAQSYLTWSHDPLGRLAPEGSPLASRCVGTPDPDGPTSYSPDCGVVITALIGATPENPAISRFLQLGILDQAGGYQALTQTEQMLQAQEMQRRDREVEAATHNVDAPQL